MLSKILSLMLVIAAHSGAFAENIEDLVVTDETYQPLAAAAATGDIQSTNIVNRNTVTSNTRTNITTPNVVTSNTRTNIITSNVVTSNTRTNIITPNVVTSNTRTAITTPNVVTSGHGVFPSSEWLKPEITLPEPEMGLEGEVEQQ